METAPITQDWIARFTREHGRSPRILHMGNVCNNAYQTAKMLNAAGADCDVYCADNYYVMANPEWDEADFTGDVGDLYSPLWHRVDLHGYRRPRWFAQGPMALVLAYLTARRSGTPAQANRQWRRLERARRHLAEQENGTAYGRFLSWSAKAKTSMATFFSTKTDYLGQVIKEIFTRPKTFIKRLQMKLGRLPKEEADALLAADTAAVSVRREAMLADVVDQAVLNRVLQDARTLFPDRDIRFDTQLESFMLYLKELRVLLAQYDVIQAYAAQVVWPYLAGFDFVGYEHGTLRDYVYEESDLPRLSLLGFARAKAVYLTNIDCYDSAVYITQTSHAPIVCGLHGIDVERIIQKINLAVPSPEFDGRFGIPADVPLFYSPSRHTWLPDKQLYLKGDDKVVGAAARLAAEGYRFKLVLSAWGDDIDRLKEEIARHPQLEGVLVWHRPLGKAEFYTVLQKADAVLDQFYLRAYGGIVIEALSANAAPLITCSVPEERLARFFDAPPPYLPADSEDDIYAAMRRVLDEPEAVKALAAQGRDWIMSCHNHANIVQKCCQAYQALLPQ